jgi:M6 family metalloprotease-like protein
MKRGVAAFLVVAFVVIPLSGLAQIYPPKPGVDMPQAYFDRIQEDRTAFQFQRAWLQKVENIKQIREAYIDERGFYNRMFLSPGQLKSMAVTGTVQVPVFCSKYANTGADPYPASTLDTKLFSGPYSPQTLTQFYDEISYGDLNMTGSVYGWFQLSQNDTYYEGPAGCAGTCGSANVGQFITETLTNWDPSVDFGQYDNDGPDGIPNSGDDDGYADFVAFVHPEAGAECGGAAANNIWSHRWVLSGWIGGSGWTTNDPAAGGGNIRVNDYVIQPAYNCGGVTVIDIGVFCHEFGHALGLPDLYDTNGGSAGIGHWGLMGSGSWNSVTQPAHMNSWSKNEMGWVNLVEIDTPPSSYNIANVEFNRPVYRANIMNERWRRETSGCSIAGTSMRCGLRAAEAAARAWGGGEGYGNGWDESVSREFHHDGGPGPVWFDYDYRYDSETAYDYTYARIDVGGTVNTIATYHGTGSGTAHIDISSYLGGSPTDYTLYFEFQSDGAWSDEDNSNPTTCGSFVFDNVAVNGGGEAYFTDFEVREDGWWCDMTDPSEYFMVENRQPQGSDVNVHGGGGLAIWQIDQDVAHSTFGNTGGPSNTNPRGVALEQADGLLHLESNTNRGDAGDAYPGSSVNTVFDPGSVPNSNSYSGTPSNVSVVLLTGNGDPITVSAFASWAPPMYASSIPPIEDNDKIVYLQVYGTGFQHGCDVELVDGVTVIGATDVEWNGKDFVVAEIDINGASAGDYDIVLTNPGNGAFVATNAFTINDPASGADDTPRAPAEFALKQNYPNPFNPVTLIPFDIKERVHVSLKIYNIRGQVVRTLVNESMDARSYGLEWDGRNDAGTTVSSGVYFYKLVAGDFHDVRKLVLMK